MMAMRGTCVSEVKVGSLSLASDSSERSVIGPVGPVAVTVA